MIRSYYTGKKDINEIVVNLALKKAYGETPYIKNKKRTEYSGPLAKGEQI